MNFDPFIKHYLNQPHEVSIETLARCNAACTFCPYPGLERIGTKMPDQLIDRLIGEMAEWNEPFIFSPFKVNEPFLDKRLERICQKFEEDVPRGVLRLFTNGSALTRQAIEWVSELEHLAHLWISLNETDPQKYEELMAIPFHKTVANLDALHKAIKAGKFNQKVVVSTVGSPNDEFKRYCYDRWPLFESFAIKKDAWIKFTDPQITEVPDTPCGRWFELSIMANGKVALCCMDGTGEYSIGDITNRSMLDVYNDPVWRERREGLWSRKKVSPCSGCTY